MNSGIKFTVQNLTIANGLEGNGGAGLAGPSLIMAAAARIGRLTGTGGNARDHRVDDTKAVTAWLRKCVEREVGHMRSWSFGCRWFGSVRLSERALLIWVWAVALFFGSAQLAQAGTVEGGVSRSATNLTSLLQGTWYYNSGADTFIILGQIDTISFSPIDNVSGSVRVSPSTISINYYELSEDGTALFLFDLEGNVATLHATLSFAVTQSSLTLSYYGRTGYYARTIPPTPTATRTATPTPSPTPTRTPGGPPIVVGKGTAASCTDAALNAGLTGGGVVTFNCGGGLVTIDISTGTGTKTISADTTIDGGSLITISGGNSVGVFSVNTGVNFTVQNLTITHGDLDTSGGIYNNGGTLTVTNSTFSGNIAASTAAPSTTAAR